MCFSVQKNEKEKKQKRNERQAAFKKRERMSRVLRFETINFWEKLLLNVITFSPPSWIFVDFSLRTSESILGTSARWREATKCVCWVEFSITVKRVPKHFAKVFWIDTVKLMTISVKLKMEEIDKYYGQWWMWKGFLRFVFFAMGNCWLFANLDGIRWLGDVIKSTRKMLFLRFPLAM